MIEPTWTIENVTNNDQIECRSLFFEQESTDLKFVGSGFLKLQKSSTNHGIHKNDQI